MIAGVGDKERVGPVEKESARAGEFGDIGGGTVAAIAKTVDAGDGGDIAGRIYAANAVVEAVGNIECAKRVDDDG